MFDRKKYKQFAIVQLNKRIKIPVIMTLITLVISGSFILIERAFPDLSKDIANNTITLEYLSKYFFSTFGFIIFSLISTMIIFVIQFAEFKVYLKMSKSPDPVYFKDFTEGFKEWAKALRTGLWEYLWVFIWSLISIPVAIIFSVIIVLITSIIGNPEIATMLLPLGILLTVLGFIPAIIKGISYSQCTFLACEYEKVGAIKALNLSKKITANHKKDLFLLALSFIGWIILNSLTFSIASLWVSPYMNLTQINAYHALLKEAVDSGKVTLAELGVSEEEKNVELLNESSEKNNDENL